MIEEVLDLSPGRVDLNSGVEEPGGANHLLHHLGAVLVLIRCRRSRHIDNLIDEAFELIEVQRPVVQSRGEAEAVLHQSLLAGAVSVVHASDLGKAHM